MFIKLRDLKYLFCRSVDFALSYFCIIFISIRSLWDFKYRDSAKSFQLYSLCYISLSF